jgi:hypothetical protein
MALTETQFEELVAEIRQIGVEIRNNEITDVSVELNGEDYSQLAMIANHLDSIERSLSRIATHLCR